MALFKRPPTKEQPVAAANTAPPPPSLAPFELWSQGRWCNQDVVGESHRVDAIRALFPARLPNNAEITTVAELVPEPQNPHDRHAVQVRVDGTHVGYLPREIAARYQPLLIELTRRRIRPQVPCEIRGWIYTDFEYDRKGRAVESQQFRFNVSIALDEPHLCVPVNEPPSVPHEVLPVGGTLQVTGEEHHLDSIEPFLRREGAARAYATLHVIPDPRNAARDLIEVRLNDRRVGQLTPKMSGELLPSVRHLEAARLETAVRATVLGNRLKAEVKLHTLRSHELPAEWLARFSPPASKPADARPSALAPPLGSRIEHAAIPPKPTRIVFNPPPTWPTQPPDGWEPPPGWRPPADWPPAPPGWQFWILDVAP